MQSKQFKSINPGDMVIVGTRSWKVTGVYLGCLEQENAVGLEAVGLSGPCVPGHGIQNEMIVPLDLIPAANIFRVVDHEAAKQPRIAASR